MPRKKKIIIIFHLCCAFSYFSWLIFQPYAQRVVTKKSELALFERVVGYSTLFQQLPLQEQQSLIEGYEGAQNTQARASSSRFFIFTTPPFALAWLFFSIAISLLLLFRIEGAHQSVWLLPLFVIGYAYFSYKAPKPKELSFFPSENYIITKYLNDEPGKFFQRRSRLLEGWHYYLIAEWAHEDPSVDPTVFKEQLDRALFAFNVERLKWILSGQKDELILAGFASTPSFLRFLFYFAWNLFFAWTINRKEKRLPSEAASNPN